jgi:hypothetical protein
MKLARLALLVGVCTGLVFAQASTTTTTTTTGSAEPAAAAPAAKPAKAKTAAPKVSGTIVAVDAVANTIIIKAKTAEDTLTTDANTKIMSSGKAITLADLKTDEKVSITYKVEAEKKLATMVKVIPPPAPKK